MNKSYPYTGEQIWRIYTQLYKRGLAMFLGCLNGEPRIWMSCESRLSKVPVTIATAEQLLEAVLIRELEGLPIIPEVLVGEVLDSIAVRPVVVHRVTIAPTALERRYRL